MLEETYQFAKEQPQVVWEGLLEVALQEELGQRVLAQLTTLQTLQVLHTLQMELQEILL